MGNLSHDPGAHGQEHGQSGAGTPSEDAQPSPDDVGAPLDTLLTHATQGIWRRLGPSMSTAKFVAGLALHPVSSCPSPFSTRATSG